VYFKEKITLKLLTNMKKIVLFNFWIITFTIITIVLNEGKISAQAIPSCGTNSPMGPNLICNGDFERGDSCFTTMYTKHSTAPDVACGSCFRNWSNPDEYEVVTNVVTQFHTGFTSTPNDHTPTGTNHFMAVDGSCSVGKKVWTEGVTVSPATNYFFTMWFTSLHSSNPALLQFDINGTNVGVQQQLGAADGIWYQYTFTWASGATSGPITISIENMTVTGCGNGNDFAIDDVSFTSGCQFGVAGPQPNLGPDISLCVSGGTATLNSGVTPTATMFVTWSDGTTGSGFGAPYTHNVSSPGTYSVCVRDGGSCIKSDVIVVTNAFSVNIGPDVTLCNPTTALLDAGITTAGISYQWLKGGVPIVGATNKTYTATGPGTYRVNVTIPGCGTQFDDVVISTNAAIPNDVNFCPPAAANLSVTGTGTYEWYAASTGGAVLATGAAYSPTPAVTTTYWVRDASSFNYAVGPTTMYAGAGNDSHGANQSIEFTVTTPFILNQVTVYADLYTAGASYTIGVNLNNTADGTITQVLSTIFAPPTLPGNPVKIVVPVGISVPVGTYRLSAQGTAGTNLKWNQSGAAVAWPFSVPGVVSLTGLHPSYAWLGAGKGYGYFYDWQISAGNNCARVPVTATVSCAAPVELISFTAKVQSSNMVNINWSTANETDAGYFVIERSFDGIHFTEIKKIPAHGNSNTLSNYSYPDMVNQGGSIYYKLVQYDTDGTPHSSQVVSVKVNRNDLVVYPNPTKGSFNISFDGTLNDDVMIEVINPLGQIIHSESVSKNSEKLNKDFDLSSASSGVYFVKVQSATDHWLKRIVKE
jgi:hypothetical protein